MPLYRSCLFLVLAAMSLPAQGADPFAEMVRLTPWLSPPDELKSFKVPPGFAVQLVAAEPEIGKPISMSFDASGRLWVAETSSYPLSPEAEKSPKDVIRILSDFASSGQAGTNKIFADDLLVPDAVAPYGEGAVIFTMPNIERLQAGDHDGRRGHRERVLGPFAVNDTHNMANNFRRGFDGWMYGGQGVANRSKVMGGDGREFQMSGGTFRFQPDGSRIQKFGDGQANVFGLCFDPLGNLFTSDCHSMPIYQNIYGGFYPVFGKPHDGLGYAPQMLDHNHGSTAISGLITCEEPLWPAEFQGNFLLGNVVTSRINRDRIEERGSTKQAVEMPDFLTSEDPWFRPVDVQFGPDGALYIADFYNRIIAHVEIPLDHPGRDRTSGRIWRVVRLGPDGQPLLKKRPDFRQLTITEKVQQLADPSLAHRLAVLNALADQGGPEIIDAIRKAALASGADLHLKAAALWIVERLGVLTEAELTGAARDRDRLLRTHAMRILVERQSWTEAELSLILTGLQDPDGFVARAAADGLARHPAPEHIPALLALRQRAPEADTHLVYQARKALRDQLLLPEAFPWLSTQRLTPAESAAVADVCLAVPSAAAAGFLADTLTQAGARENPSPDQMRHIARYGEAASLDRLIANLTSRQEPDPGPALALFQATQQGLAQRGMTPGRALQDWAYQLAGRLLTRTPAEPAWQKTAAEMAAQHQLTQLEPRLATILNDPGADPGSQAACLTALLSLKPEAYLQKAAEALNQTTVDIERRTGIGRSLANLNTAGSRLILTECMRQAPGRLALNLAALLCGTGEGADALLQAVTAGHAPASLLTQRSVRDKLLAVRPRAADEIARLTANLSPNAGRLQKTAQERQATFPAAQASAETGAKLFQIHCAVCHNIAGQGGRVGPELDGIGHRGLERLCEDVLDPNRNVDRVFRYSLVNLKDGSTFAGLYRREEGAVLIFTDAAGKDLAVNKDDIASRTESESSLMPEVFADLLTPADFHHLMAFLLSQTSPR